MEINPRIQGTLEMLEGAGDISVTQLHYEATKGILPLERIKFEPTIKLIVYSRFNGVIHNLSQFHGVVDKSPPGVLVKKGDPICTIIYSSSSIAKCYTAASNIAIQIQREVRIKRNNM